MSSSVPIHVETIQLSIHQTAQVSLPNIDSPQLVQGMDICLSADRSFQRFPTTRNRNAQLSNRKRNIMLNQGVQYCTAYVCVKCMFMNIHCHVTPCSRMLVSCFIMRYLYGMYTVVCLQTHLSKNISSVNTTFTFTQQFAFLSKTNSKKINTQIQMNE